MNTPALFPQIAKRIIKEQELVIGPLAWEEARKVQGLQVVDQKSGEVNLQNGNVGEIIICFRNFQTLKKLNFQTKKT